MRIDETTTSDEIFPLLDSVESDNEEDVENLLDDSDTEFICDESATVLKQPRDDNGGECSRSQPLVPEAVVHIVNPEPNDEIDFVFQPKFSNQSFPTKVFQSKSTNIIERKPISKSKNTIERKRKQDLLLLNRRPQNK